MLIAAAMLSLEHEAPLVLLREEPALVPALVREALGLELPPFATADISDPDSTQPLPVPFRADLVVKLQGADGRLVMGLIVEVQRSCDEDKRWSWPLYAAALHARLRCQIGLVVIATDEDVARWAASPIRTVQVGAPFAPLVIGPDQIPQVLLERARREPRMAVLSALAHARRPGGIEVARAALATLADMSGEDARLFEKIIMALLRNASEDEMPTNYETLERLVNEMISPEEIRRVERWLEVLKRLGLHEDDPLAVEKWKIRLHSARALLLTVFERLFGPVSDASRRLLKTCLDPVVLEVLAVDVALAPDRETAERLIDELETAAGTPPS